MTTNFEKIKSMNIEELTNFFVKNQISCIELFRKTKDGKLLPCIQPLDPNNPKCTNPEKCLKHWLQLEAEN